MRAKAAYIWIIIAVVFVGGFLFAQTSGLLGRSPVTTTTAVATVNGRDVLYTVWLGATQQFAQQQEQQQGHALTLDERRQAEDQAYNELVSQILLDDEYQRRGIHVSDQEIVDMARYNPPPQFQNLADLQTDGRFDPAKYQRFLASPAARQQGILVNLENYFRSEIPKQKLFQQIAGDVYMSDARLWTIYRDTHDSASVSYVSFKPVATKADKDKVTDAEISAYFNSHKKDFDRPGTAALSIVTISRRPTAADSAETLKKITAIRAEIANGAKFDDVAKRESDDSVSGSKGGDLGRSVKNTYVKPVNDAMYSLAVGTVSQPIKSDYGYHVIRVDKRTADTVFAHHILKLVKQGDSSATRTDRQADQLAKSAAGALTAPAFDSAAKKMSLLVSSIRVTEGQPANYLGRQVPSVSAWAFGGPKVGESSDLFDDDAGYYLVRLDSIRHSGVPALADVKEEIREAVARQKALDSELPKAKELAKAAAGSTLEAAAKTLGRPVEKEGPFARSTPIAAFGFVTEVSGAAMTLPVGDISEPIRTDNALFVIRVDKRVQTDSTKFQAQKATQRLQVTNSMRDQKVRMYIENLRRAAKITDHRKDVNAMQRRATT